MVSPDKAMHKWHSYRTFRHNNTIKATTSCKGTKKGREEDEERKKM